MKTITVALNVRLPNCYEFARAMALSTLCTAALAADPPESISPPPDQGASVPAEAADAEPVKRKKARRTKQSKPGDPASGGTAPSKNAAAKAGKLMPGQDAPQPIEEPVSLETVEVIGRETDLLGVAESASQGVVGQNQFKFRPLLRVGELVEVVPGMIATQHSGSGKANQYFLRGFNLDHGTDFAVWLDGMPMNLPTNAHGQGYLDLNMIIPELIDRVEYGKGPYYAEMGDFATAGFAQMHTMWKLPQSIMKFTGGEFDFYRGVVADSTPVGPGEFLYAGVLNFYNGPWVRPMDLWAFNGMMRYTIDRPDWGFSLIGKGYNSHWYATNQIPEQLVKEGLLDLYGTMNPTDGGNTNRYALNANLWSRGDGYKNEANFYVSYYDLALYSDFTFFLVYPEQGDQILQKENSRMIYGGNASQTWFNQLFGTEMDNSIGIQVRSDTIDGLELANTEFRQVFNVSTLNNVVETSIGLYAKSENRWTSWFRTIAGLREDIYKFNVRSELLTENSGARTASIASPKLSFIFGPWAETEFFVNMGYGFHSNDARGTVARYNPVSGDPTNPVTPLSRAQGAEVGARSQYIDGLNTTLAFWFLHSQSELVFVGDEGTTEPLGPGNRYGVEWTNYYQPLDWLTLDADFAFTKSYFTDLPSDENRIPNSVGNVITSGATVQMPHGLYSTLRLRHFSNVPLNEAGTVFMGSTTLVNFALGWQQQNVKAVFELFNIFDSKANDIAYYYNYRLPDQPPEGVEGKLIHPVEPRMVRATLSIGF